MTYESKLPNPLITKIPNEPVDAVPELWNPRYEEVDENFENLDQRQQSVEDEIAAARAGEESLPDVINAIVEQIGGISGTLSGLASPTSIQNAVNLDWLYRGRRIAFELFATGYELRNHQGVGIISGVMGDDSIDIESTAGIKAGEDYVLFDGEETALVRVTAIHSDKRLRLSSNLPRAWGAGAVLTGSTFAARPEGGVDARVGAQWVSKALNLGDDRGARAIVIRRTLSAGVVRLFFRDSHTTAWTECYWSVRRSGGGTSGVPAGMADYEYIASMRGDGFLRIEVDGEDVAIRHIVGLGAGTELGGYINPLMRPARPSILQPADEAIDVGETPTITVSGYSSPAGNAFAYSRVLLSLSATFDTVLHDSGRIPSMTYSVPAGVIAAGAQIYQAAEVEDAAGLVSERSVVTSFTAKSSFAYVNTPTIISPTNGQTEIPEQPTIQLSAFATTGESDTHKGSQFQFRLEHGTWDLPFHDSGLVTATKTSYTPPAGVIPAGEARVVIRARQEGNTLGQSEWSADVVVTTKQLFAQMLGIVQTSTGGGAGAWQRVNEKFESIATTPATFNNHPVYAAITPQAIDGQAMVRIPRFYVKEGVVPSGAHSGKRYWLVSDQPADGFAVHPAFMLSGSPIDQFWVGQYQGVADGSKLGSSTGKSPLVSIDFPTMQARATARNVSGVSGFQLWDIYQLSAIQTLALIEMGGSDSQTLIGQGNVSGGSVMAVDNATVAQASWRGIVGLWGNIWQMVDGLQTDASSRYKIWDKNGNKSYITTTKTAPASGWPVTMATESGADFDLGFVFAASTTDGTQGNGSYGDYFYQAANCVAYSGGSYGGGAGAGLFNLNVNRAASHAHASIGGRLAKV